MEEEDEEDFTAAAVVLLLLVATSPVLVGGRNDRAEEDVEVAEEEDEEEEAEAVWVKNRAFSLIKLNSYRGKSAPYVCNENNTGSAKSGSCFKISSGTIPETAYRVSVPT
jgi:hypothetical protein